MTQITPPLEENNIINITEIGVDIKYIKGDLKEIRESLKDINSNFVSKEHLQEIVKILDARLKNLEDTSKLWKFISPLISAVGSAIITFLIIHYLQHI